MKLSAFTMAAIGVLAILVAGASAEDNKDAKVTGGNLAADILLQVPSVNQGKPFPAILGPDYVGRDQDASLPPGTSGVMTGPTNRPTSFHYKKLPVLAIVPFDKNLVAPLPKAFAPWDYSQPLFKGESTALLDRRFSLAHVGWLTLTLEADGQGYSVSQATFHDTVANKEYKLTGTAAVGAPPSGAGYIWYGVKGLSLHSADNTVKMDLNDASWKTAGNGWPGALLDKNIFPVSGGNLAADISLQVPSVNQGKPFPAILGPDYIGRDQDASLPRGTSGVMTGPTSRPTSFHYKELPVLAIVPFDKNLVAPLPKAFAPWDYSQPLFKGDSTALPDRRFSLAHVGWMTLTLEADGQGYSVSHATFHDTVGNKEYQLSGTAVVGLPPSGAGYLWYGVNGLSLHSADNAVKMDLNDASWKTAGSGGQGRNGWPGALLDKNFFPLESWGQATKPNKP